MRKDYQVRWTEFDGSEGVENFSTLRGAQQSFRRVIRDCDGTEGNRIEHVELIEVLEQAELNIDESVICGHEGELQGEHHEPKISCNPQSVGKLR